MPAAALPPERPAPRESWPVPQAAPSAAPSADLSAAPSAGLAPRPSAAEPGPTVIFRAARPHLRPAAAAAEAALAPPTASRRFGWPGRRADPAPQPAPRPEAAAGTLRRAPGRTPGRPPGRPRDPAPSRLSYRLHRFWLTPLYRRLVRVGLPAFALALGAGLYLSDEGRREALAAQGAGLVRQLQERPEFMVGLMAVEGASPELGEAIRTALPVDFPVSSFDLDLDAMRSAVLALDAVAEAELRVRPGGILEVRVAERVPALLWRGPEGLVMLDATGHRVAPLASRLDRPDLPVIAGEGAEAAVPEALALIEAAAPVAPRLRGLVRMGERRWDVVLDNGQRILLPEIDGLRALERVMALAEAEDMLERDVSVIDMRYGARPTLRLSPRALDLRRGQEIETGATSG
jgi:cell division protein FtsQ